MPRQFVVAGFFLMFIVACENAGVRGVDQPGMSGAGGGGSSAAPGMMGPAIEIPEMPAMPGQNLAPPKACGEEKYTLERSPAEIIFILDRSSTMGLPVGGSPNSRLTEVAIALDDVIKQTQNNVYWGLRFFPPVQGCDVGNEMEVDLALDNHPKIAPALMAARPNGMRPGTPMQLAVRKATTFFMGRTTPNPKYIVLGTDGLPNCRDGSIGADDTMGTIQAIADARAAGIRTFVVGIAPGDFNPGHPLNAMADAGGQARLMEPRYYPVNNRAELAQVLNEITVRAGSCVFPLSKQPSSPDHVTLRINGKEVPKDASNGWSWNAAGTSVVLNGNSCSELQQSRIPLTVQVLFGCQID